MEKLIVKFAGLLICCLAIPLFAHAQVSIKDNGLVWEKVYQKPFNGNKKSLSSFVVGGKPIGFGGSVGSYSVRRSALSADVQYLQKEGRYKVIVSNIQLLMSGGIVVNGILLSEHNMPISKCICKRAHHSLVYRKHGEEVAQRLDEYFTKYFGQTEADYNW
ncbi:hypothetical protein [Persicobacter psychrovividus]|uniref:DUF4468 domain-containing protein n=1 Tax=Persicobacter psychrovividus TaxID=387638 RepID=A0ABM7VIE5_9BACT|nr:hypothetical protein PEPS_30270 [Persicobacter psychrovividus]